MNLKNNHFHLIQKKDSFFKRIASLNLEIEKKKNSRITELAWGRSPVTLQTLFTVSSRVEAIGGGGEFCRAGSMCHLCLTVTRMHAASGPNNHHHHHHPQLMYEVLADQTMWAVCGRTAGIVSLEVLEKQSVTLDVMPLTSGYLPLPVVRLSRYIPAAVEMKNGNVFVFL